MLASGRAILNLFEFGGRTGLEWNGILALRPHSIAVPSPQRHDRLRRGDTGSAEKVNVRALDRLSSRGAGSPVACATRDAPPGGNCRTCLSSRFGAGDSPEHRNTDQCQLFGGTVRIGVRPRRYSLQRPLSADQPGLRSHSAGALLPFGHRRNHPLRAAGPSTVGWDETWPREGPLGQDYVA